MSQIGQLLIVALFSLPFFLTFFFRLLLVYLSFICDLVVVCLSSCIIRIDKFEIEFDFEYMLASKSVEKEKKEKENNDRERERKKGVLFSQGLLTFHLYIYIDNKHLGGDLDGQVFSHIYIYIYLVVKFIRSQPN